MKKVFWTTIFWVALVAGFLAYLRWFDQPLAQDISSLIVKNMPSNDCTIPVQEIQSVSGMNISVSDSETGSVVAITSTNNKEDGSSTIQTKLDEIKSQLKDINEKLDIQNSNTPDAVSVSLKTTRKTNVFIFPLDGGDYKKYVLAASDDILKDALNLLFDKSAFVLSDSKLDNDGNLVISLQKASGSTVTLDAEQVKNAIEKTALQFPQIKKVLITPEDIFQ